MLSALCLEKEAKSDDVYGHYMLRTRLKLTITPGCTYLTDVRMSLAAAGPRLRLFILDAEISGIRIVDHFGEKLQFLGPKDHIALGERTFRDVAQSESSGLDTVGNKLFLSAVAIMSRLNTIWAAEQGLTFPSVREEDFDYASDDEKKKRLREWVRVQCGDGVSGGSAHAAMGRALGGLDADAFPTSMPSGDSLSS